MKYDLIGQTFNMLTVIKKADIKKKGGGTYWECECECGNTTVARTTDLLSGYKKSCGCLKHIKNDLTGQVFGRLKVLKVSDEKIAGAKTWMCQCECGNIVLARTGDLTSGAKTSCGCGNINRFDLTGMKFNKLSVIEKTGVNKNSHAVWECLCECGNITTATTNELRNNHKKSCGCLRKESNAEDLKGQVFGRLRVSKRVGTGDHRRAIWRCRCECGKYVNVRAVDLKSGNTKSCGCLGNNYAKRNLKEGGFWYEW